MRQMALHRSGRLFRRALALGIFLQGIYASSWTPMARASPDIIRLAVSATSNQPPAAVADLLASPSLVTQGQISLTWTAPQGNAGNFPMPNWPVGSYAVRYATFSVASVAGSTTTWRKQTAASNI